MNIFRPIYSRGNSLPIQRRRWPPYAVKQSPSFGATWTRATSIPAWVREKVSSGFTSSDQVLAAERTVAVEKAKARAAAYLAARQTPVTTTAGRRAAAKGEAQAILRAKSEKLLSTVPQDLRSRIQASREQIERTRVLTDTRKATEAAAKAEAEGKRQAWLKRVRAPSSSAGVKAWREYYARMNKPWPANHRGIIERKEKQKFYAATASLRLIQPSVTQDAGLGRPRQGTKWMIPLAYGGTDMPYWEAWYNKTMSARQIAQRIATDLTKELARRSAISRKHIAERESWQDAGRPGPAPVKDPSEGILSPITAPKVYTPPPRTPEPATITAKAPQPQPSGFRRAPRSTPFQPAPASIRAEQPPPPPQIQRRVVLASRRSGDTRTFLQRFKEARQRAGYTSRWRY